MPGIDGPPLRSSAVTIPQPPYPVDGNGSFSNIALAVLVVFSPWVLFKFFIPYFTLGFWSYLLFLPLTGIPTAIGYWLFVSRIGGFKREAVVRTLPNKPMSYYFTFKDIEFARQYSNRKIPMTTFYEAYFDQKLDFNRKHTMNISKTRRSLTLIVRLADDILQTMEARHDWASFALTTAFFYDFFTRFLPDVIMHTSVQDAEQIRDHYDRCVLFLPM